MRSIEPGCRGGTLGAVMLGLWACAIVPCKAQDRQHTINDEIEVVSDAGMDRDREDATKAPESSGESSGKATKNVIIPVPMGNPQLGGGVALTSVWFYQPGGAVRPWTTGIGAFRTSNKSWGAGALQSMSLAQDRFRVQAVAGYADINMRYFGSEGDARDEGQWVEVKERTRMLSLKGRALVSQNIFVGARLRYQAKTTSERERSDALAGVDLSDFVSDQDIVQVSPLFTIDTTHEAFAPRSGTVIDGQWNFSLPALGSAIKYNRATLTGRHYIPSGERNSLALRAKACRASDNAPFFDVCPLDLRGYSNGRFRDQASWSVEGEWRQKLGRRFGLVGFVGIGATGTGMGDAFSARMLPMAGAGVRFLMAEAYGVNLRLDGAIGRDSHALYVSIGESF